MKGVEGRKAAESNQKKKRSKEMGLPIPSLGKSFRLGLGDGSGQWEARHRSEKWGLAQGGILE